MLIKNYPSHDCLEIIFNLNNSQGPIYQGKTLFILTINKVKYYTIQGFKIIILENII